MSRDTVNRICAALPGAELTDPWGGGHQCWKIGGKMFAITGTTGETVSVKTDGIDTAEMLIAAEVGLRAAYLHRSWVALPLDTDPDEMRHRIEASYHLIRAALPKKVQATFDEF